MAGTMTMVRQLLEIANTLAKMDEDGVAPVKTGRRGRPKGSTNKPKAVAVGGRRPGRPKGSKNKPKSGTKQLLDQVKARVANEKAQA